VLNSCVLLPSRTRDFTKEGEGMSLLTCVYTVKITGKCALGCHVRVVLVNLNMPEGVQSVDWDYRVPEAQLKDTIEGWIKKHDMDEAAAIGLRLSLQSELEKMRGPKSRMDIDDVDRLGYAMLECIAPLVDEIMHS